MRIKLPFPPTVNHYYHTAKNGMRIIGKAGKEFQAAVAAIVISRQMAVRLTDRLRMTVTLHYWQNRAYDLDNRLKALLDAMEKAGVYADDSQIDQLFVKRGEKAAKPGHCTVTIEALK